LAFIILANQKNYTVTDHAALRMMQRGISEQMIINVLEHGSVTTQPHENDLYEHQIYVEEWGEMLIIQVVVDEDNREIRTVIDDTSEGE